MGETGFLSETEVKRGKSRHYDYPSYPIEAEIPTLNELKEDHNHIFIATFPGNHNGLIWITRQKLNEKNHKAFIYATVVYARERFVPCRSTSWQFWRNLKKLRKAINSKKIVLSAAEQQALKYMEEEMPTQTQGSRETYLKALILDLERAA